MAATAPRRRIQQLPEDVVNKIAAGEVIQRPANAIKEMLENALDAGATSISVTVKDGGLKLLQIQDDGCGISKEDLPLLCVRFATSKLSSFDDLQRIGTFGFRGEALASISHVGHLTVTTKTAGSPCAYKATYKDGVMVGTPTPCAGTQGTRIVVEDLFYNVLARRKALSSRNEEYRRIIDVVTRYAVHNAGVAISCRKAGDTKAAVHTQRGDAVAVADNIRELFGSQLARELLPLEVSSEDLHVKVSGLLSNANYSTKKNTTILFINKRSVDCPPIRRAINAVYADFLPKKTHPFFYLDLTMPPHNVDVNVHPTKKQVHFLHEEQIIALIQDKVGEMLQGANASRTYYTQALLPTLDEPEAAVTTTTVAATTATTNGTSAAAQAADALPHTLKLQDTTRPRRRRKPAPPAVTRAESASTRKKPAPQRMVRTDPRALTMDKFLYTGPDNRSPEDDASAAPAAVVAMNLDPSPTDPSQVGDAGDLSTPSASHPPVAMDISTAGSEDDFVDSTRKRKRDEPPIAGEPPSQVSRTQPRHSSAVVAPPAPTRPLKRQRVLEPPPAIRLTSVRTMCAEVMAEFHQGMGDLFVDHKFVGSVDARYSLIQHLTKLYLVDVPKLTHELFFQLTLAGFGCFSPIRFSSAPSLEALALIALNEHPPEVTGWKPEHGTKEEVAGAIASLLVSKREMLAEYFTIHISDHGILSAIPQLLQGYVPPLDALPLFVLYLSTNVDWTAERACFESLAIELARFYGVHAHTPLNAHVTTSSTLQRVIEHTIFPALRQRLVPTSSMATDGSVLQIASLENLYRVFERC